MSSALHGNWEISIPNQYIFFPANHCQLASWMKRDSLMEFSISIGIEPKQLSMQMQVQHLRQEAKLQLHRSWGREMEWKRRLVKWWHIAAWRNGKMRLMWLMAIAAIGSLRVQLMHLYNFLIKSNALACRFIVRMVLSTCMRVSWFHLYFIYMVKVWDLHMCLNNRLKSKENMVTNGLNNKVYTLNLYCY